MRAGRGGGYAALPARVRLSPSPPPPLQKPVYVFDGKPPTLKSGELAKRHEKKEQATKDLEKATEEGNVEDIDRFSKRLVKMDKSNIDEAKKLLRLMGMPVVDAPCEVRGCGGRGGGVV